MARGGAGIGQIELTGNRDIDGILWGHRWTSLNLTFSCTVDPADYAGYDSITGFAPFLGDQRDATRLAIGQVNSVCGLNIVEVASGGNLRFGMAASIDYGDDDDPHPPGGDNDSAEGNPPDPNQVPAHAMGDCWFNSDMPSQLVPGGFYFAAWLLHEIGHSLGLAHGHEEQEIAHDGHLDHTKPTLPPDHDSQEYSIMTYRAYPGAPIDGPNAPDYPQTLMMNDIAALQYMYGADYGFRSGDNVYRWSQFTGEMSVDGVAEGRPLNNVVFRTVWDGGGIDTYDLSNYTTDLVLDLRPGGWSIIADAQLAHLGTSPDGIVFRARGNIANALLHRGDQRALIENAVGGLGNDRIFGNDAANIITGGSGDDVLFGINGDDRLVGGLGRDSLNGGFGFDLADYDGSGNVVVDLAAPWLNTGAAAGDRYHSVEDVRGSRFNDVLNGDEGGNALDGGLGNGHDNLFGRGGDDILSGAGGGDYLVGGGGADILAGGDGFDYASYETAASGVVVDLAFAGANSGDAAGDNYLNIENLAGSAFNDELVGDAGGNWLEGRGGADLLLGRAGLDWLEGGDGHDSYRLDDLALDPVSGALRYDNVIERINGGIDTVLVRVLANSTTISTTELYVLAGQVENGIVIGDGAFDLSGNGLGNALSGNSWRNVLSGLGGADRLDGGAASDSLKGGAGNDYYLLNDLTEGSILGYRYDHVEELAGEGIDTVEVAALDNPDTNFGTDSYTLGNNVENGIVRGSLAFNLIGNVLNNVLTGGAGTNMLIAGDGRDSLTGAGGHDVLYGEFGDDTYHLTDLSYANDFVRWSYDDINEGDGGGVDTVFVTAIDNPNTFAGADSYTLEAFVENGNIVGNLNFNLIGNVHANRLVGGSGANTLIAGDANDFLNGGAGHDTLYGEIGDDRYVLNDLARGPGGTLVYDMVLEAAGGGRDVVVVASLGNPDTPQLVDGYTLAANVEVGIMSGTSDFNLIGNALANRLDGNDARNNLLGNDGADRLSGGLGTDRLIGGGGRDQFCFDSQLGAGNTDYLSDFAALDDTIFLDRSIFSSFAANGKISADAFKAGATATDASDRILYEASTGRIFYDSDGSGGAARFLFARVQGGTALDHRDFTIYTSGVDAASRAKAQPLEFLDGNEAIAPSPSLHDSLGMLCVA